ncbi:hypothetical protein [Bacteroides sp.]|uniref:hypothetical protein n=1 Tax=Bacteroides sp. TaxID=29523 RepID=UPI0025C6B839|nr:hypothetical protein [Bacteroides sp.]
MGNLKINYVCFALSILCLLLMSCKNDEEYPYPIGKELVDYELTLFRLQNGDKEPTTLPEDYIIYYDSQEVYDDFIITFFFYEGKSYGIGQLPISEIRSWNINEPSVKVLLSGKFIPSENTEMPADRNEKDDCIAIFLVSSLTLK